MNIVDILIVGLVLLGALRGYHKGLFTSLLNFIGNIGGFLLASLTYLQIYNWLESRFHLQELLEPVIYSFGLSMFQTQKDSLENSIFNNLMSIMPPEMRAIIPNGSLQGINVLPPDLAKQFHSISTAFSEKLLHILTFILAFWILSVLIRFIGILLIKPLGLLGETVNHGGGMLFGGLAAIIVLAVLAGIFSPVIELNLNKTWIKLIHEAYFYPSLINIFHFLDNALSAQLSQKLLGPFNFQQKLK